MPNHSNGGSGAVTGAGGGTVGAGGTVGTGGTVGAGGTVGTGGLPGAGGAIVATGGHNSGGTANPGDTDSGAAGSDAGGDAEPPPGDGGTPLPPSPFVVLDYEVVDAEQSASLASIVMVSDTPSNRLHIFNEITQADRAVTLPAAPVAVAVDPSGKNAAVAYDANVSFIDLQTGKLRKTCPLGSNAYDIALTDAGVAYVVPRTDQWVPLHAVAFDTCTDVTSSEIRAASHMELHPSQSAVFLADQGLSPSRVNRCDVTMSPAPCNDAQGQADWGTYSYCGNLWMSQGGERIYTACGVTLRVPGNVNGSPSAYGGTLEGVTGVQHLFEAGAAGKLALIPLGPTSDGVIRIHETKFLNYVRQDALPGFPAGASATVKSHGRFVFTTNAFDVSYVIVQADPSGAALHDFAVATFTP